MATAFFKLDYVLSRLGNALTISHAILVKLRQPISTKSLEQYPSLYQKILSRL